MVTIPDVAGHVDFHQMLGELDSQLPELVTPPTSLRQRIFQNRTALIAGCATLGSAAIAGTVALIVHFTSS